MQIFVKKLQGMATALTLNVKSSETIYSVKRRLEDKEAISSDFVQILIYGGKHLDDLRTLAHYNIVRDSTLHLLTRKRLPHIYVKNVITRKIITLSIVGLSTIDDVRAKIHELEGIPRDEQCLYSPGRKIDENQTLLENQIVMESTLHLVHRLRGSVSQSMPSELALQNVSSQGRFNLRKRPAPQVATEQNRRARPATPKSQIDGLATQTTPSKSTAMSHSIFHTSDGEVCAEYIQGIATSADRQAMSHNTYEAKLNVFALYQAKATAALSDLMPEIRSRPPPSVLTELEDVKRKMVTARSKEKLLKTTISRLTHENKVLSAQCASCKSQLLALEAENKKTKEEATIACSKKKKLEVTISRLAHENKVFSARSASYESQVIALEAEDKKSKEKLIVAQSKEKEQEAIISRLTHGNEVFSARCTSYESQVLALEAEIKKTAQVLVVAQSKEKEQEATIARLRHKNEVFSAQCASYESQVVFLEAEYKKTNEELMVADKKFYTGARAAGYAEGLREGKAKWLKSVEFLNHLTDASMQYFNHGFDSCQKQAEQQGFVGQLNKNSALKEAPFLKDGSLVPGQSNCPSKMEDAGRNTLQILD